MMHQTDILTAAIDSVGTPAAFDTWLTELFGSAFTRLYADPVPPERARRKWESMATVKTGQERSQIEHRVVDVTLRDILRIIHSMPLHDKAGWRPFLDALTLRKSWTTVSGSIGRIAGPPDSQSGYFWASMLAATAGLAMSGAPITATGIATFPAGVSTVFDQTRYPRANSGATVKGIKEMTVQQAVNIAAREIDAAWHSSTLPIKERTLVLEAAGSALSADLHRHPAAVRYLLAPAVSSLRTLVPVATLSLDQPAQPVEGTIYDELGMKWHLRNVW